MTKPLAFPADERLKKRNDIAQLIEAGKVHMDQPLRMVFIINEIKGEPPIRVAFAVSKRKFKSAVKRNLLKRRMREAYRISRMQLKEKLADREHTCSVMFQYVGHDVQPFESIQGSLVKLLSKIEIPE
jgi:ribonuclease P protein component